MHFITSHFSCLTYISLFVFWSDAKARSKGVVCVGSQLPISVIFCIFCMVKTYIVENHFLLLIVCTERFFVGVDILLSVVIQCSVTFFMCVLWSSWNRHWVLGSDPFLSTGFLFCRAVWFLLVICRTSRALL